MNGAVPPAPAADGRLEGARHARHVARRVEYRIGRALAAFASGIGCLAIERAKAGLERF